MSRKNTLEPRWLVSMLTDWVRYCVKSWDSGLGYPSKTPYLADSVQFKHARTSYDGISLNAYNKQDFENIERVMHDLSVIKPELFAAVNMYYRPWTVKDLKGQGYPFGNSTYYDRLHAAHAWLKERLRPVEERLAHVEEEEIV